jgi:hypothetical protein
MYSSADGLQTAVISDKHSQRNHDGKIFNNINKRTKKGTKVTLFAESPTFTAEEKAATKKHLEVESAKLIDGRSLDAVHVLDVKEKFDAARLEFSALCKWYDDREGWPMLKRAKPTTDYKSALKCKIVRVQGFRRSGKSLLVENETPGVFIFNFGRHLLSS